MSSGAPALTLKSSLLAGLPPRCYPKQKMSYRQDTQGNDRTDNAQTNEGVVHEAADLQSAGAGQLRPATVDR